MKRELSSARAEVERLQQRLPEYRKKKANQAAEADELQQAQDHDEPEVGISTQLSSSTPTLTPRHVLSPLTYLQVTTSMNISAQLAEIRIISDDAEIRAKQATLLRASEPSPSPIRCSMSL